MARLSIVGTLHTLDISSSSILHIGDHVETALKSRALAVQREVPFFYGNEGNFEAYPFYHRPIPIPQPPDPVTMTVDNWGSFIRVGGIRIIAVASSSLVQIGSNCSTQSENKIKHFRQFVTDKPGPKQQTTFVKTAKDNGIGDHIEATVPKPKPLRPSR
ncbi:spore germination protein GerPE [Paenibacillus sp. SI8]|uniref:spore germination protein GerPE n=1 Tax=unclassified Paenibacillus TaxID=185978 RepID=UPI0034662E14